MKKCALLITLAMLCQIAIAGEDILPAHGLRLPATFTGVTTHLPDKESTWVLSMWPDQTFQYNQTISKDAAEEETISGYGRWYSEPLKQRLVLDHGRERPLYFTVNSPDQLQWADSDQPDTSGVLQSGADLQTIELENLIFNGMMIYMADAATITLCQTNRQYPISNEGDYLALERAYLADRPAPGEPLFVMLQGGLAEREPMEGSARQMIIVDRFLRTDKDQTCERKMANSSLFNTYWRIDEILGEAVTPDEAFRREPHMLLQERDKAYSLTVGCNLMRGGIAIDGEDISFSAAAATMMACPPPVDKLERDIATALGRVARFAITSDTLSLMSDDGSVLVSLTAVYL